MRLRILRALGLIVTLAASIGTLYAQGPAPSADGSVFVPLMFNGRQWGLYELGYLI